MELLKNTTNILLIIIAVLLVGVILLQAVQITHTPSFQTTQIGSADTVGYALYNPTIRHESFARYYAPGLVQTHKETYQ